MFIFTIMLAFKGVYPFSDGQILIVDFWHQYYPFISELWHRLRDGGSLLWSFTSGGGHDYLAHIGYYLASPFNFLAALFPHQYLREVITLFLVIKIGFAGFFMSLYLRYLYKRDDVMIVAFAALYALCAWSTAFYWNIMWMDTFATLPLVILGLHRLITEGKFSLFVISLALSVVFNFYIGFFVCIFVSIMFILLSLRYKPNLRQFLMCLLTVTICAAISIGLTAFLTLPVYSALQQTGRATAEMSIPSFAFNHSFIDALGGFAAITPTAGISHGGLPNIYSGLIAIMLYPVFLLSKISLREKIGYSIAATFMLISTNINVLNFIWHGFSVTHGLPYRYTFLISFVMIVMAYRAYILLTKNGIQIRHLAAMCIGAVAFLTLAFFSQHSNQHVLWLGIGAFMFISIFVVLRGAASSRAISTAKILLCVIVLAEVFLASFTSLVQGSYTTNRGEYPWAYDNVQTVLRHRQPPENDFFRTDFTARWGTNDPAMYNVQGISLFSSMANQNTLRFMNGLGLVNWSAGNSYAFAETSPLTPAFLNMRYLVDRLDNPADDGVFWNRIANESSVVLMENSHHLPLGFIVRPETAYYVGDTHNPFNSQNNLFRLATGLDGDLFTLMRVIHVGHENLHVVGVDGKEWTFTMDNDQTDGIFRFNYLMPENTELYAYIRITSTNGIKVTVGYDEQLVRNINASFNEAHLFRIGSFGEGDMVTLQSETTTRRGSVQTFVGILNRELFEEGFAILASEVWELAHFSETRIAGNITTTNGGLMYTSIPYTGNWRAFIDGERIDVVAIDGAMAAVNVPAGSHHIEFVYHNSAYYIGLAISGGSLVVFVILIFARRRGIL